MGNLHDTFFDALDAAATWSAGVAFKRSKGLPLDKYSVFESKDLAIEYAEKRGNYAETPVSYPGQVIAVAEGSKMVAYVLAENAEGTKLELQQIGIIPTGDSKTVSVTDEGVISLLVANAQVDELDENGEATGNKVTNAGAQLVLQSDGTLKWVQPDTSTAEGQAAAISALQDRMTTAEGDIDKLEQKVGTPGEGQEGTLFELIAAEAERAAGVEKELDEAIKAIDFIDATELATALTPYAKTDDVNTELNKKVDSTAYAADKQALENADAALDTAVKAAQKAADDATAAINNFLAGTGAEGVIDTLTEIQTALNDLIDPTELATSIASKADKVTGAVAGNFAGLDENGNLVDSGKKATDFATPSDVQAVDNKFASYTNTEDLTGLLAGKVDTTTYASDKSTIEQAIATAKNAATEQDTVVLAEAQKYADAIGETAEAAAAKALSDAKADTDAKLANYYNKTTVDTLIKDFATDTEVAAAVEAEAKIARAAEQTNAGAIADVSNALGTAVQTLEGSISATDAKAQKGVDDAKAAKEAADGAQASANTNALNIAAIENAINGYTVGEGEGAQAVEGLISKVAGNTSRIAAAEGVISTLQSASHTHAKTDADISDAVEKRHTHNFVESELNKIADGDVAKWNAAEQNAKTYAKEYADGLAGNYAASKHEHTKSEITDFAHTHEISEVNGLTKALSDAQANAEATAAGALSTYKAEMVTALAGKQDVIPANTYDTYGAAAQALVDAKAYSDSLNHEDTKYGIVYDSENKKIKLVSDTTKTEIDATDFIKDGMIESVALSEDGLNLVITWNTDSDKGDNNVTTIPLAGLVDVYTGVDGTTVKVEVFDDNKISAEVKEGAITNAHIADATIAKGKLASDVQTSLGKADTAVQAADLGTMATETAADYVKKTDATGYADILTRTEAATIYQIAGDYATATQGAKADTALQTIAAGTGLKATVDTTDATKVTVEIDENVLFILNGGSASV